MFLFTFLFLLHPDPAPLHAETAQVMLEHGNTSSYLGKALHYFNTTWRTVCDKNWTATMSNSHVLCRQLGLGHAVDHWLHVPGERDVNFLHTNMKCSGTENKLRLCEHNFIADGDCSGESVPWVVCSGKCMLRWCMWWKHTVCNEEDMYIVHWNVQQCINDRIEIHYHVRIFIRVGIVER